MSPNIPTSFVPKQPVRTVVQRPKSTGNVFLTVSFFLLGLALLGSAGVFAYQQYLNGVLASKEARLEQARQNIDSETVADFIKLRNRFTIGEELLSRHVAVSQFFDVLEGLTLQSVRFNTFTYNLAEDGSAEIEMEGTARNFNALAAESNAFGAEPRIRSAIFSGITVNANGSVSFALSAELAPDLIVMRAGEEPAGLPAVPEDVPAAPLPSEPAPATTTAPQL